MAKSHDKSFVRVPTELIEELRVKYDISQSVSNVKLLSAVLLTDLDMKGARRQNLMRQLDIDSKLLTQIENIKLHNEEANLEDELRAMKQDLELIKGLGSESKESLLFLKELVLMSRIIFDSTYRGATTKDALDEELSKDRIKGVTQYMGQRLSPKKKG